MLKPCDKNIDRTLDLTQKMIALADQGDANREDIGCGILYGVLRDAAYKIRRLAEIEKQKHEAKNNRLPNATMTSPGKTTHYGTPKT